MATAGTEAGTSLGRFLLCKVWLWSKLCSSQVLMDVLEACEESSRVHQIFKCFAGVEPECSKNSLQDFTFRISFWSLLSTQRPICPEIYLHHHFSGLWGVIIVIYHDILLEKTLAFILAEN